MKAPGADNLELGRYRRITQSSLLWAMPFFVLAVIVAFSGLSSDRAWPVAVLLMVGVLIAVVPGATWKEVVSRVENVKFGTLSIGLQRAAGKAAALAAEEDTGEGVHGKQTQAAKTMAELRLRLEAKFTYIAKHLLVPSQGNATFLTVGSLRFDGYLTDAEARTALGILSIRQEELDELPEIAREAFLKEAGEFVDCVRASVFWGQVKKRLTGKEDGNRGESLYRREIPCRGSRDDFLAGPADCPVRVASAFAVDSDSEILRRAIERLEGEGAAAEGRERQLIVIPENSREGEVREKDAPRRIVKLGSLREALLEPA